MELRLDRYLANAESTLGNLYINDVWECYTCEDAHHDQKIQGKTRIPAGTYQVFLRALGTSHFDAKYLVQFSNEWFKGMLQLENVPGYEGVEIHIGNTAKDTDGCILVGEGTVETADSLGSLAVTHSTDAFEHIYPQIRDVLLQGEKVHITISDE